MLIFRIFFYNEGFYLKKKLIIMKYAFFFYARHGDRKSAAECFDKINKKSKKVKIYSFIEKNVLIYKLFCLWG